MDVDAPVAAGETHLSRLFFTPDRVFKLLKPVALPFVDFSDTQARLAAAAMEFERNRAISPDVYLGLADVCEHEQLVDRMIVMRRLPADREFRRMLEGGADPDSITAAARMVARLHAGLEPLVGADAEAATAAAIARNWEDNLVAIAPHVGSTIDAVEFDQVATAARAYLRGRQDLFARRIADGWVRDGHGDLRAEHIYLTDDGPRLIDCVAFDDRLRISDSLADVAFLAMDLDRLAGPDAAAHFMRAWNEFTNEHHPSSLAHFYVAYRAHVRCKIACLRHEAGQPGAADTARRYHRLAQRHLRLARVRLVLVGGGPGTGKSTLAEHVAEALGAAWLRSDEVRKDLVGAGHGDHAFAAPGEGIYSAQITERVQAELARQARSLLGNGVSVVIDATWRSAGNRAAFRQIAAAASAELSEFRCELPDAIAKERIARRMASLYNPSDATPELVDYMRDRFDDWPEAIPIDTGASIQQSFAAARAALGRPPCVAPPVDGSPSPPASQGPPAAQEERGHNVRFSVDLTQLRVALEADSAGSGAGRR